MTYHWHFDKSNSTDATSSQAPITRPEHVSSPSVLMSGSCCLIFIFLSKKCFEDAKGVIRRRADNDLQNTCVVFFVYIIVFPFPLFHLAIVVCTFFFY